MPTGPGPERRGKSPYLLQRCLPGTGKLSLRGAGTRGNRASRSADRRASRRCVGVSGRSDRVTGAVEEIRRSTTTTASAVRPRRRPTASAPSPSRRRNEGTRNKSSRPWKGNRCKAEAIIASTIGAVRETSTPHRRFAASEKPPRRNRTSASRAVPGGPRGVTIPTGLEKTLTNCQKTRSASASDRGGRGRNAKPHQDHMNRPSPSSRLDTTKHAAKLAPQAPPSDRQGGEPPPSPSRHARTAEPEPRPREHEHRGERGPRRRDPEARRHGQSTPGSTPSPRGPRRAGGSRARSPGRSYTA